MKKQLTLSFCFLIFFYSNSWNQTGPCGVGNSASNKVWLDVHAMGLPNGAAVSSATDYSGNGNNFLQPTSSRRPINNTGVLNGLPVITFDGINDRLQGGSISDLETSAITYFIVYQRANLKNEMLIDAKYASQAPKFRTYCNSGNNKLISAQYSPVIKHVNFVAGNTPAFMSSHITATNIRTYNQGTLAMSLNASNTTPTGHQEMYIGSAIAPAGSTQNYPLDGFIAEVILYNTSLTNLQRILVENYLSAKYGLSIPTDLYAYDATHNIELVGVGNNGTNSQTIARGKDIMELSNPTGMGSNEYLLAAHTDFPLTDFTTSDMPASLLLHQRYTRTWRAGETGDVGNITISFDLGGGNDFANSASYRLLVDNDGNFTDATVVAGTYTSGSVSFTINLSDGQFFTLAGIEQILEIHSVTDGDWGTEATWDCICIPSLNDEVYIDPLTNVTVDEDAFVKSLSVEPNGKLIMDQNFILNIREGFDIAGDVEFTDGAIAMVGTQSQYIDAAGNTVSFNDLIINNTGPADIDMFESQYELYGTLFPTSGGLVLENSATEFIVKSTSSTTGGRIAALGTGFNFSGEFTVQHFIPSGNADWRDLASPVTNATFNAWDPDLEMSGIGFPDGCAYGPDGCFYSVRFTQKDIEYKVINSTDVIVNSRGYTVFCGDNLTTFSGTTLNTKGTLNNDADVDIVMNDVGWWTMGNPYACPITYNTIDRTSQVSNYYYIYDSQTGGYQWYDGASSTSSIPEITANGLIGIGQGIWVYLTSSGTATVGQSDKSLNDATYIRSEDNAFYLALKENASTYSSKIAFEENNLAEDGLDSLTDIRHLTTGNEKCPNVAVQLSESDLVRKNWIRADMKDKSFKILTEFQNEGFYTFTPENIGRFSAYNSILLFDSYTKDIVNLKDGAYTFYSDIDSSQRFTVIFSNENGIGSTNIDAGGIIEDIDGIQITQMGSIININSTEDAYNVQITLYNALGQIVHTFDNTNLNQGSNVLNVPGGTSGVRILSINHNGKLITKKLVF